MNKALATVLCAVMSIAGCSSYQSSVSRAEPEPLVVAPAHTAAGQVGRALNAERRSRGLHPVSYNPTLSTAAMDHARDMSRQRYFSHDSKDGTTHFRRVTRRGYNACLAAENIARGYASVDTVMQGWMDSPGHRRNNLHRGVYEYGAAYVERGNYWVLVLARECDS